MDATVRANCPKCKAVLRIPAQWVGQAVKCKKCGATVKSKAKAEDDTPANGRAAAPAPANAFDFSQPQADDDFFGLPAPAPAPVPVPAPAPVPVPIQLDANGYPIPHPAPGGYPVPPGYPYPMPSGYGPPPGYPAPVAGPYPYPAPVAYPQPVPHGHAAPPGYAPLPGYGYPAPVPVPAPAAPVPAPVAQPGPLAPTKPGGAAKAKASGRRDASGANPIAHPAPAPAANEFEMEPAGRRAARAQRSRGARYRRDSGNSKFIWIGVCLLLTAGLVAGGIYGGKLLNDKYGNPKDDTAKGESNTPAAPAAPATAPKAGAGGFPRRLLFVSVTKYMYLNPLTQAQKDAPDKTRAAANRLAYTWQIPNDPKNNQVFVLSDTVTGADERLPTRSVIQGTFEEFFKTSRGQDRIAIYFGGHAIEKGGKAYLAPMEAELDGEDWEKSVIPLEQFYDELNKCKAAQKVVIWDVCRYNPEKGKVRPGSEPMSEALYKALTSPPPGVQAVTTCKPGENAMEFSALLPDSDSRSLVYSGSVFLESMRFVAEPRNKRLTVSQAPADPLPVTETMQAIAKRTTEMAEIAEKAGNTGKQTVSVAGAPPAAGTAPDATEPAAARFVLPQAQKGASQTAIKSIETEFMVPPMTPDLARTELTDFPFSADVMKGYAADVPLTEIMGNKEKYAFRVAVVESLQKVRDKWATGAGTTKIRREVKAPIDDKLKNEVKKENDEWAIGIIELEDQLRKLKDVAEMQKDEPKRWQAHYDFAVACVKARLAYMNEYNKILGTIVTETLPTRDEKLGQDGYLLVASETLKSGKDVKKLAEEAQEAFQEIAVKYKGTPWAIQAKQEKSVVLGLNWKAASLKKE